MQSAAIHPKANIAQRRQSPASSTELQEPEKRLIIGIRMRGCDTICRFAYMRASEGSEHRLLDSINFRKVKRQGALSRGATLKSHGEKCRHQSQALAQRRLLSEDDEFLQEQVRRSRLHKQLQAITEDAVTVLKAAEKP